MAAPDPFRLILALEMGASSRLILHWIRLYLKELSQQAYNERPKTKLLGDRGTCLMIWRKRKHKKAQETRIEVAATRRRVSAAESYLLLYITIVSLSFKVVLGKLLCMANRFYAEFAHSRGLKLYPPEGISFLLSGYIGFCVAVLTCDRVQSLLLGPEPKVFVVEFIRPLGRCLPC